MGSRYYSRRIPGRTPVRSQRSRPKSFRTEDAAKKWAADNKVTKFSVKKLSDRKYVVQQ